MQLCLLCPKITLEDSVIFTGQEQLGKMGLKLLESKFDEKGEFLSHFLNFIYNIKLRHIWRVYIYK